MKLIPQEFFIFCINKTPALLVTIYITFFDVLHYPCLCLCILLVIVHVFRRCLDIVPQCFVHK